MNLYPKIAYNTVIQITGKVIAVGFGLAAIAIMTRYLGQEGFGKYTTIMTFLSFFGIFADFGFTLVTVQMINKKNVNKNEILSNLFSIRLLSAFVIIGIAPIISLFFPYGNEIKTGILITLSTFIFIALNQVFIGLFQSELKMSKVSIGEVVGRIVFLLGIVFVVKQNAGLYGVMFVTTLSSFINFLILFVFSKKINKIKLSFNPIIWKEIITNSWPIALTVFFNLIYLKTDTLILSIIKTQNEVGIYGAAYKVIEVLTAVPFMFVGVILPIMVTYLNNKDIKNFKLIMQSSFDFMIILVVPMIIGTQFLSKKVMMLVAGPEFIASGAVLKILILALGIIFIGTVFSHSVIALGKQKEIIKAYIFTGITALIGYFIFIPKFSYFGAAWTTVYSEVIIAFSSFYYTWKYTKFLPKINIFLKAVLSSFVMVFIIKIIPEKLNILPTLPLLILVYFISLYIFGGIKKENMKMIFNK